MRNSYFLPVFLFLFSAAVLGQNQKDKQKIIANSNTAELQQLVEKYKKEYRDNLAKAEGLALVFNWKKTFTEGNTFSELVGVTDQNKPIYFATYNSGAGVTSRANRLYTGGSLGLNINGEQMLAGVWDAGSAMPSHQLFTGRLQVMDGTTSTHYHAAHVAGTVIGSETVESGFARGMAYKANAHSYNWNNDAAEVADAAANGLLLSNHSYGYNPSFVSISQWGKYDQDSQDFDNIMFNAPYYQFVCAAGNSRNAGYNSGKNGYDLLTGHTVSKNGIVVAAVNEVSNYTGPTSVVMSSFSSWGPTDDGRIKPDISAKGVDTYSAMDGSNASYSSLSGTSMASPSVTGTLLLLQQYYNQQKGSFLKAATLRGLMIHTADEAGSSPGPDYRFGWGLINAEKAANVITKNELQSYILENTLSNSQTFTLQVNALGTEPLVATLAWTDPAGNLPSSTTDDATANLVNDLDIRITKASTTFSPWKMNPANPSAAATTGDNLVDNVEKVEINNPSGSYTITISHKGSLQNLLQNYSLIVSGVTVRDFWITSNENLNGICAGVASTSFDLTLQTKSDFTDTVNFSALNLPSGVSAVFLPNQMTAAGNFVVNFNGLNTLPAGNYEFVVRAQTGSEIYDFPVQVIIYSQTFSPTVLQTPTNNSVGITTVDPIVLAWQNDSNAQNYFVQISLSNTFATLVESETVNTNQYSIANLQNSTTYYWRVRSLNECGQGSFSAPFNFTTSCSQTLTNLNQVSLTSNAITVAWVDDNSTSWEVEVVPEGSSPTGMGTVINSNPYTVTNLESDTCYTLYIRSACSVGFSEWVAIDACTQPDYCNGDNFYDTGGASGSYQNNENWTQTISPSSAGERVRAIFNSYSVESCCDYLTIFNGPDTTFPVLFNGGFASPGTVVSTHPSGALTFRFITDSSVVSSGWDATIICEEIPACAYPPSNINLIGSTSNTLVVGWTENSNATSWEVEIVAIGSSPTGAGQIVTNNPYTFTSLNPQTGYTVYVRSACNDGFSDWVSSQFFYTSCATVMAPLYENFSSNQLPSCWSQSGDETWNFSVFADYEANEAGDNTPGGGTNYAWIDGSTPNGVGHISYLKTMPIDISNLTSPSLQFWVFSKYTNGAQFNTLRVEVFDGVAVYNLYNLQGQTNNGWQKIVIDLTAYPALNDVVQFSFSIEENGDIPYYNDILIDDVKVDNLPACPNEPSNLALVSSTASSLTIGWLENGNSTNWEVELVPQGASPTGVGTVVATNPYTFTQLLSDTCYTFYVRALCPNGGSEWMNITVCTPSDYCNGDHFYDTGGPTGSYQNGENWTETIFPAEANNRIRAIFNSYSVESCCDVLRIYNGPDTTFPLLFNGGSVSPGTIVSTHSTGALTFRFTTDSSVVSSGWDATIVCEEMPACANPPSALALVTATSSSVTVAWTENGTSTSWEMEVVPSGGTPTGNGTVISTNPYTISGLLSDVCYNLYLRSLCEDGGSDWISITVCTPSDYCGGDHFYDTGGATGNYQNNENWTETIYPSQANQRIRAIFNSYSVESCCDYLRIYNGPNTTFPLLFNGGSASPGNIVSTHPSGALTFRFTSDSSVISSGWDATIICEEIPPCSVPPNALALIDSTVSSVTIGWIENGGATSWEMEFVPQGSSPTGTGTVVSFNPILISDLPSGSCYTFYVRSLCDGGQSAWISIPVCTQKDYCGGDHFYDTGGVSGVYQNYENWTETIYPAEANQRIRAIFNSYNVESCCDFLRIYNGPDTTFPLLFNGGSVSPGNLVSTHPSGALTFRFTSDGSVVGTGWDATIICENTLSIENPNDLELLTYYPNPVVDQLQIDAKSTISSYKIYDTRGRLMLEKTVQLDKFVISFEQFASGLYMVILEDTNANSKSISILKK